MNKIKKNFYKRVGNGKVFVAPVAQESGESTAAYGVHFVRLRAVMQMA